MPKRPIAAKKIVPKPELIVQYNYAVQTIRALPGGKFIGAGEFQCGPDSRNAKAAADRLQREFDDDCDPCRTYVYRGNDPIPVYAGLQRQEYGGYQR